MIAVDRRTHPVPAPYILTFTAASLRPELARIVAEAFLCEGGWDEAKQRVLRENALQARTESSSKRMEREFRQRLQCLSIDQLKLLATGTGNERTAMSWLAMLKYAAFVREFAVDLLRRKLAEFDSTLRPSDYENFIVERLSAHPELHALSSSTKKKVEAVLLRMLCEAGLLVADGRERRIQRPILTPGTIHVIATDDPRFFAGFLWTDEELAGITKRV
jgi:hypothetical protein